MITLVPDDDLMTQFIQGNPKAFDTLYYQFYDRLEHFAHKIIRDEHYAKDITNETFTKLWLLRYRFYSIKNVKSFLYMTTRNSCIDYIRHTKRQKNPQNSFVLHTDMIYIPNDEEKSNYELMNEIYKIIDTLPLLYKKAFTLRFLSRYSHAEIANVLNISEDNARQYTSRAMAKVRKALKDRGLLYKKMTY